MRKITFLIYLFCGVASLCAATIVGQRSWEEGALSWADFKGNPLIKNSQSYMSVELLQDSRVITQEHMQSFSISAKAVMYPEKSYVDSADRTDLKLRYFQAQFDLLEVMRRRFQSELAQGISGIEADRRLTFYANLYNSECRRMAEETDNGGDDARLQFFEYDIRRQLEDIGMPPVPNVVPSKFKYGFFLGTGMVWQLGELSDAFSSTWDFTFGLKASYRRFNVEGMITYGNPSLNYPNLVNTEYDGLGYRANVKNANYLAIGFNGGFSVFSNKHLSVSPYIGGMWTSNTWTSRPMTQTDDGWITDGMQQKMDVSDFNLTFGINFEWHFHSVVTNFPFLGSLREEYISNLRLTPYMIRSVYGNANRPLSGWQIGFMLSYSGVARALGIK